VDKYPKYLETSKARTIRHGFIRRAMQRSREVIIEAGFEKRLEEERMRWLRHVVKQVAERWDGLCEEIGLDPEERGESPSPLDWAIMLTRAEAAGEAAAKAWLDTLDRTV